LYDLPAEGGEANGPCQPRNLRGRTTQPLYFSQDSGIRQPRPGRPWSLRNPLIRCLNGLRIVHRDFCG